MELVVRLEGEQLEQELRLVARPSALVNGRAVHGDAERAEHVNL
jgi:hypothetical protein